MTIDLEETLLGPLVAGRECGDCVACCDILKIDTPGFTKEAGAACPNNTGSGCAIHPTRPAICRAWFCAWRRIAAMPDAARPDRSGVLAFLGFNRTPRNCLEGVYLVAQAREGGAFETPIGQRIVRALSFGLVPVWLNDGKAKILAHPRGEIANPVLSGTREPSALSDEVDAWRARYDMFR